MYVEVLNKQNKNQFLLPNLKLTAIRHRALFNLLSPDSSVLNGLCPIAHQMHGWTTDVGDAKGCPSEPFMLYPVGKSEHQAISTEQWSKARYLDLGLNAKPSSVTYSMCDFGEVTSLFVPDSSFVRGR